MIAVLTGMGLSAAAGLNPWIPFLALALLARFTDLVALPAGYGWMSSWWAIGVGAVLLAAEVVLDKVPVVDSVNDAVQTAVRPAVGGLVASATAAADRLDHSAWMQEHSWVAVLLGVVVAALVHTGKTAARPVVNAGTAGVGAPVVSTIEDVASVGLSLVAILAPVLVVVLLVGLVLLARRLRSARRRRRRRRARAGVTPRD
ncbi:DUF4126 domain-containing protein [Lapillicoccus jejuensis]|uniref:Uncharacterized protein DUF4126 n=1 Tax=Lapillicoccus jejuensis TaxID=402171 RepID=A0A542E624_9MICO|nr:DUF4126 domain-containing protein [Lapillicoccus jejuensis]TQJ10726.1 uncharacterized protein DUF4126 [Lapillicoccus jejuensis]